MSSPLMSARRRALLACFVAALACAAPAQAAAPSATDIVQLRPGVSLAQGRALVRAAGGRVTGRVPIIHGLAVRLSRIEARAVARDPRVRAVSPNARVRAQDVTSTDVDASRLRSVYPSAVYAPRTWPTATGAGVGVAVIDTGIAGGLPDFEGPDGSSRVIASAVTNPDATTPEDTYGHGTHVAGIIAGYGGRRDPTDPVYGKYIGIAPDADLISIKTADDHGVATVLDVIYGLQFAVDHKDDYGIRVVNLSLESTTAESYRTDPLDAALESAYFHGLVVVAAAGNHGTAPDAAGYAPGNDPFAITVGAIDDQDTPWRGDDVLTEWSSVGATQDSFDKPDVAAPGAHIVSTLAPGSDFESMCPSCIVAGEYIRAGGTSMAAPVVSGVVALMLQLHPDWTPDEAKTTILTTARDIGARVRVVDALAATFVDSPSWGTNEGIEPAEIVDAQTGDIDYTRSSWTRSSWTSAADALSAGWARSSWTCTCADSDGGQVDPTRSSWTRSSWTTRWSY